MDLKAKRVTFNVESYTTNGKAIMDEEFNGFDVPLKSDYAYISLSLYVEIQTTKACMFDYCPSVIIDQNANRVIDQIGGNITA